MRIGVIADIHGNLAALEAVAEDLACQDIQRTVCLGDLAWKGPAPAECIRWVRQQGMPCVLGNGDAYLVHAGGFYPTVPMPPAMLAGEDWRLAAPYLDWHVARMTVEDLSYLARLPLRYEMLAGDQRLLFVHGTPQSYWEGILSGDAATATFDVDADWLVVGHTHRPFLAHSGPLTIVNPGAVGFSLDRDWRASYAVIDTSSRNAMLRRVPYSVDRMVDMARTRRFCFEPEWYGEALRAGWWEPIPWRARGEIDARPMPDSQ